jgi:hypothetical protein
MGIGSSSLPSAKRAICHAQNYELSGEDLSRHIQIAESLL